MNALEMALHYFRLSNEQKLENISQLFDERSTYSSDKQGLFLGRGDIMAMMTPFFAGYRTLKWTVHNSSLVKPGIAEIDFSFEGEDSQGNRVTRTGIERIASRDGLIYHIEVRTR